MPPPDTPAIGPEQQAPQGAPLAPVKPSSGQPPFGSSPATGPTPNKGLEAQGLAGISMVVRNLERLVPLLGAGTEQGRDVLKALNILSKHVPAGAVTPAAERNQMDAMRMRQMQLGPQLAQLRAGAGGGAGGGAAPAGPGAAPGA